MKYAIIVAGGSGSRFGSETPKQFLPLKGIPVLMRTINRFKVADNSTEIILVLPAHQVEMWQSLCTEYAFDTKVTIVTGGSSRFESVSNAIHSITPKADDLIAIHDGVRPLVAISTINEAYRTAAECGTAIPAVKVSDSIRTILPNGQSEPLFRDNLRAVQTPQTFRADVIVNAYDVPFSPEFTDDASVVEKTGRTVTLIEGTPNNIKITHPIDLIIAEEILRNE